MMPRSQFLRSLAGLLAAVIAFLRDITKGAAYERGPSTCGPKVTHYRYRACFPTLEPGPSDLVRFASYVEHGPPVDLTYEVRTSEPVEDETRILFRNGLWGAQIFPGGIVSALAFGAVGDGEHDDTSAVQQFLNYVVTMGVHGVLPAGRYRVTRSVEVGDGRETLYRGFTIEGAGRSGLSGKGGTLIVLDTSAKFETVITWRKNAWRDGRLRMLGVASRNPDGAQYGILIESSEISHLQIEDLSVENVTTAFGLLQGSGRNGEFCSWSKIQTWNVLNYFFSDAGQAYGLRFSDSFCYYRPGGTLFQIKSNVVGGGFRLINFDASPTLDGRPIPPAEMASTTLIDIGNSHNSPITVVGGRFEHITRVLSVQSFQRDIVVNNFIQFVGVEFTTDLDAAEDLVNLSTVAVKNTASARVLFVGCKFASAFPKRVDNLFTISADVDARGQVRFVQCGFSNYSRPPLYRGPQSGDFSAEWSDCTWNASTLSENWRDQNYGSEFSRVVGCPSSQVGLPEAGSLTNFLLMSDIVAPGSGKSGFVTALGPWVHRGYYSAFLAVRNAHELLTSWEMEPAIWPHSSSEILFGGKSGIYQDVPLAPTKNGRKSALSALYVLYYRCGMAITQGIGPLRISLCDSSTGQIFDETVLLAGNTCKGLPHVEIQMRTLGTPRAPVRLALDNLAADPLGVTMLWQTLTDRESGGFVRTRWDPVVERRR